MSKFNPDDFKVPALETLSLSQLKSVRAENAIHIRQLTMEKNELLEYISDIKKKLSVIEAQLDDATVRYDKIDLLVSSKEYAVYKTECTHCGTPGTPSKVLKDFIPTGKYSVSDESYHYSDRELGLFGIDPKCVTKFMTGRHCCSSCGGYET